MSELNNSMLETLDAIEGLAYEDDGSLLIPEGDLFKSDVYNVIRDAQIELTRLQAIENKYNELLGCVLFKHERQTRHDTAKKYIVAMCEISDARNWKKNIRHNHRRAKMMIELTDDQIDAEQPLITKLSWTRYWSKDQLEELRGEALAELTRLQAIENKYNELLGCVLFKHERQTRHDTAKKYIVAMCEISDARNWKKNIRHNHRRAKLMIDAEQKKAQDEPGQ